MFEDLRQSSHFGADKPRNQNFGMTMPGWYDIVRPRDTVIKPLFNPPPHDMTLTCTKTTFSELAQAHDEPGILKSRDYFNSLIKAETEKGIPSNRIVLGRRLPLVKSTGYKVLTTLGSY